MAIPVEFPGYNHVFGPPPGHEETIGSLHTFVNGKAIVSAWKLTPEELEEVKRTGIVFASIFGGRTLFPMFIGGEDDVRRVVADSGPVWAKADLACFNKGCGHAGTHFPVIMFGAAGRVPGEALPYRLEIPLAACKDCQPRFNPDVYVTEQARLEMASVIVNAGKPQPDFSGLRTIWKSLDDPVWAELKGGGEARFIFG